MPNAYRSGVDARVRACTLDTEGMDGTDESMDRLLRVWKATRGDVALRRRIEAVDDALAHTIVECEAGERASFARNAHGDS
jgi:hypothetical protein